MQQNHLLDVISKIEFSHFDSFIYIHLYPIIMNLKLFQVTIFIRIDIFPVVLYFKNRSLISVPDKAC